MQAVSVIAPSVVEAGAADSGRPSGLAGAAQALEAAGLIPQLEAVGAVVSGVHRLTPDACAMTDDPIENLGRFNAQIAGVVRDARARDTGPLLTGGTCSHLPGMIAGLQQALDPGARLGLLWLDAHGDFNTPATTPSGMLGGMPVAVVSGLCHAEWRQGAGMTAPLPTNRIMMVDVRNLDPDEERLIRATDIQIVRMERDVDSLNAIRDFAASVDALYVHIDADILDASLQPNHPTVERDGLTVAQTLAVVEAAMTASNVLAFGVVSINPDEPGGAESLGSGMALIAGGVARWFAAG